MKTGPAVRERGKPAAIPLTRPGQGPPSWPDPSHPHLHVVRPRVCRARRHWSRSQSQSQPKPKPRARPRRQRRRGRAPWHGGRRSHAPSEDAVLGELEAVGSFLAAAFDHHDLPESGRHDGCKSGGGCACGAGEEGAGAVRDGLRAAGGAHARARTRAAPSATLSAWLYAGRKAASRTCAKSKDAHLLCRATASPSQGPHDARDTSHSTRTRRGAGQNRNVW